MTITLVPVTYESVVKSDSPDFNHRAAKVMFDAIMKMDDESARMFTYIVLSDVMEETIEKNLPQLQQHLNQVVAKRIEKVMRATAHAVVKNQDGLSFAWALSEISKAQQTPYDRGYRFKESDFSRDPGSGRFRTKVRTSQRNPIHDKTAESLKLPTSADKKTNRGRNLSDSDLARYQDQYRQLANFLAAVRESGQPGDHDVIAHIQDRTKPPYSPDSTYTTTITSSQAQKGLWDPRTEDLVGLDARPKNLTVGGAVFGLSGALGRDNTAQSNQALARAGNVLDDRMGSFSQDWTKDYSGKNQNEKLYGRLATGGSLLNELGEPGGKLQSAGRMAQFVGEHGSDAEAVFGPTTRKTAYRYRGVTRQPEPELVTAWDSNVQSAKMTNIPNDISPVQMAAQREMARRRAPSDGEKVAARQAVVGWLKTRQPNKRLYNLNLAAGNTPPSEGVLIDGNGKVVAQAVGYGDDHYLPFNLKQLGKLNGGEYIRSRSVGGLTSEDIYTGLMTGAKRVTVTSRSGTFTLEFQDDIKGRKRSFNDKARRMTNRYEQLLDAVQSKQVDAQDVSPEIRMAIRQEVREDMAGFANAKEMQQEVTRRVQDFKESPEMSENEERLVNTLMAMDASTMSRDAATYRRDTLNRLAAEKEYKFRLNGNGYKAALAALEEQFPYYIKVNSVTTREEHTIETEMDRGYVEPGRNRPTAAAAGLFGNAAKSPHVGTGGKFAAHEADYQGGRGGPPPKTAGAEATAAVPEVKSKEEVRQNVAVARSQAEYVTAARQLQAKLKSAVEGGELKDLSDEQRATLAYSPDDLKDPGKQNRFDSFVKVVAATPYAPKLGETLPAYRKVAGHVGRPDFTQDMVGVWNDKPPMFPEAAYKPGASPGQYKIERDKIDHESRGAISTDRALSSLDDKELEAEHQMLSRVKDYMEAAGASDPAGRADALKGLGVHTPPTQALSKILNNPELLNRQMELVHRMRALQVNLPSDSELRGVDDAVVVDHGPAEVVSRERTQDVGPKIDSFMAGADRAKNYYAALGTPEGDKIADDIVVMVNSLEAQRHQLDQAGFSIFQDDHKPQIQDILDYYTVQRDTRGELG